METINQQIIQELKIANKLLGKDDLVKTLQRIGVGLLYATTDLGQNSIAQIMDMSDGTVNGILKGIKKPSKKK